MKPPTNVVLALYPNTRGLGYACMENPHNVIDCGIATVRPLSNKTVLHRARRLIEYYKPTLLVVQDYNRKYSRRGKRVADVITEIIALGKEYKLKVCQYSRGQIRDVFELFGVKTKYEIAHFIIKGLPQLAVRAPKVRKVWQSEDYNMGVFDALSLVLTHFYLTE